MTKLLAKIVLTGLPLLLILVFYVATDPFEVLHHYENHYRDPNLMPNRDFVSVDTLKNKSRLNKYDSYIFGNSKSLSFTCADWAGKIDAEGCFHLDASAESIYGIYKKLEWLDKNKFSINNALIVLDAGTLAYTKNLRSHIFAKHPDTVNESMFPFQVLHLKAFLEPAFFIGYVDYRITGKVRPRYSAFFEKWRFTFDRNNNDRFFEAEKEISAGTFYNDKKDLFYARDSHTKYSEATIKDEQKFMLTRINYLLNKNKSIFKIIISPSYDQLKIHNSDLAELVSIFGPGSIHDYSGINKYTSDIHNFYETIHFRRVVGKMILDEIYGQ